MNKTIIDEFVEALNKAKEATYTQLVTRLFNNLKDDAKKDYKDFKEHVDDKCDCNCAIAVYYEMFGKLSDDELKEIIKENNIDKDLFVNFDHILIEKFVNNNSNIRSTIEKTRERMNKIFDSGHKDNLEDMTKEELINMIRNKSL